MADLEWSLGVKHRKVSFESVWSDSPPTESGGQRLSEYMKDVGSPPCSSPVGLRLSYDRPARILSIMMTITTSINFAKTTSGSIRRLHTLAHLSDGNGMLDDRFVQSFGPRLTTTLLGISRQRLLKQKEIRLSRN